MIRRLWHWLTLADAPVNHVVPQVNRCWCDKPATCVTYRDINGYRDIKYTCLEHLKGVIQGKP